MHEIISLMKDEVEKEVLSIEKLGVGTKERNEAGATCDNDVKTYLDLVKERNRIAEVEEKLEFEKDKLAFEKEKLELEKAKFELENDKLDLESEKRKREYELERAKFEFEKEARLKEIEKNAEDSAREAERNAKLDKIHLALDVAKIGVPLMVYAAVASVGYKMEGAGIIPTAGPLKETVKKLFNFGIK